LAFKALPGNDNALPGNDNALPGNDNALPGNDNALPGNDNALQLWIPWRDLRNSLKKIWNFIIISILLPPTDHGW
jgi:hypothetical protein